LKRPVPFRVYLGHDEALTSYPLPFYGERAKRDEAKNSHDFVYLSTILEKNSEKLLG
jgi:hypothetical protein